MNDAEVYLIWSHEHSGWWGPDRAGYFRSIARAGRYSRTEALRICAESIPGTSTRLGALPELPVPLADVMHMIHWYFSAVGERDEPWR